MCGVSPYSSPPLEKKGNTQNAAACYRLGRFLVFEKKISFGLVKRGGIHNVQ